MGNPIGCKHGISTVPALQQNRSMTRRRRLGERSGLLLVAVLLADLTGCAPGPDGSPSRPSVILISVDTLRPDHLEIHGYEKNTAPALARFAESALLFERCYSHAPSTRLSISSLLTGYLPHETRTFFNESLPAEVDTLAEVLQRDGYSTLAVVSNYVLMPSRGWNQGFDLYDDTMNSRELNREAPERIASATTDRAIELLSSHSKQPMFLWIHYQDPHGPYLPPSALREQFRDPTRRARDLPLNQTLSGLAGIPLHQRLGGERDFHYYVASYDGEIRFFDLHFERLLDALDEHGLLDSALIVFTADHGEALGERGHYFAHVGYLHGNLTNVPMILKLGDQLRGRRTDACQHLDVVPTILGVLGIEADARLRGRDLREIDDGTKEIYAATTSPIDGDGAKFSMIRGGFKLIFNSQTEVHQLFDLVEDPGEEKDLASDPRHQSRRLSLAQALLRVFTDDRLKLDTESEPGPRSESELRRLRALGYVE